MRKQAAVVGASSGVGRAVAELLASRGYDVAVSARRAPELESLRADLQSRFNVKVITHSIDLCSSEFSADDYVRKVKQELPDLSEAYITAGLISDDDDINGTQALQDSIFAANFTGPAQLAQQFSRLFASESGGSVAVVSSIAAAVPRGRNIAYAAAKSGLESLCMSLQHALSDTSVRIQICRLGYVDTAMNAGRKLLFPMISPQRAAQAIVDGTRSSSRLYYCPGYWRLIVCALRALPWFIYKRLKF